ncbi:cation transporter [Staphylococcus aureus]
MFVGIQVVIQNAPRLFKKKMTLANAITIIVSLISGLVMLIVFAVNQRLAKRTKSSSLNSAAKDNLSDSLITWNSDRINFYANRFPNCRYYFSNIAGLLIVYTGFGIFKEAIFMLSDSFQ